MYTHNGTYIYYNCILRTRDVIQWIECSASIYKALGSILPKKKKKKCSRRILNHKKRTYSNIAKRQKAMIK